MLCVWYGGCGLFRRVAPVGRVALAVVGVLVAALRVVGGLSDA